MADRATTSWKRAASALIWTIAALWGVGALVAGALGGVLAALVFGAIASLLLAGYSSSDLDKM